MTSGDTVLHPEAFVLRDWDSADCAYLCEIRQLRAHVYLALDCATARTWEDELAAGRAPRPPRGHEARPADGRGSGAQLCGARLGLRFFEPARQRGQGCVCVCV